jgi:tetratricopeptide (TPR) repeat protein
MIDRRPPCSVGSAEAPRRRPVRGICVLALGAALAACSAGVAGLSDASGAAGSPGVAADAANRVGSDTPRRAGMNVGVSSSGNYLAGRHASNMRDFESAADYMAKALSENPKNPILMRQTYRLKLANGEIAGTEALAKRIIAADRAAPLANLGLVVEDAKSGRFGAAEKRLAGIPVQGLNSFFVPLLRAWSLAGLKRYDRAVAALAPMTSLTGFAVLHDLHTGLIQDLAGKKTEAIASLERADKENSQSALRVVQALGSLYERTGQPDKARTLYRKYISENPDSVVLEPALDRLTRGKLAEPLVTTARQGMAEALLNIGGTLSGGNTGELAMICGRLALYLQPNLGLARMLVAGVLESDGREAEANAQYDKVPRGSPLSWLARLRKAANLDSTGETDKAIAQLKAMAAEKPDRVDALINLGDLLRVHKRFDESVAAYDEAVKRLGKLTPRYWSLLYSRGIALERSNRWDRAEKDLLEALRLNPDQPYVLNYLGYSWVDKGEHLPRARDMIEKAVELRPTDGYIVDSLGWLYFRTGRYKDAVDQLERAVELKPEDPVINDHLGDAYWRAGRTAEARYQWQRALALEPETDLASALRAKLVKGLAAAERPKPNGT